MFSNDAKSCRSVWIADLLPNEVAPSTAAMMEEGITVIKQSSELTERDQVG